MGTTYTILVSFQGLSKSCQSLLLFLNFQGIFGEIDFGNVSLFLRLCPGSYGILLLAALRIHFLRFGQFSQLFNFLRYCCWSALPPIVAMSASFVNFPRVSLDFKGYLYWSLCNWMHFCDFRQFLQLSHNFHGILETLIFGNIGQFLWLYGVFCGKLPLTALGSILATLTTTFLWFSREVDTLTRTLNHFGSFG